MKQVLVLGSGLVSRPLIRFILEQTDHRVIVGGLEVDHLMPLFGHHPRFQIIHVDVRQQAQLSPSLKEADLVISLLPYSLHVSVARLCLCHGVHLITTSYVSEEMKSLHREATEKGLLFLNEIGLDPGIDHMSAKQSIDAFHRNHGRVDSFVSCCGGLPAPEANDNPLGYKFSWSPRGVLLAMRNPARFLQQGRLVQIKEGELFHHYQQRMIEPLGLLELYPNRDSLHYRDLYQLEEAATIFRGTLRYPGWCRTMEKLAQLGLLDDRQRPELRHNSWNAIMARLMNRNESVTLHDLADHLAVDFNDPIVQRVKWLGLLSEEKPVGDVMAPLDLLTSQMTRKMCYLPGERDLILLQHEFIVRYDDRMETVTSRLLVYGDAGGDSAMSKTVALPAAIAAGLFLEGKIKARGVRIPVLSEFYEQILPRLAESGIVFSTLTSGQLN